MISRPVLASKGTLLLEPKPQEPTKHISTPPAQTDFPHSSIFCGTQSDLRHTFSILLLRHCRFMKMANDFKASIGFKGTLLLEPKPQEPTKHQYDWDAATTIAFLHKYGLIEDFKLNIECNHATLSGMHCIASCGIGA
jgi:xylose isomerase